MITEDYCSFEVSKLLKEKGFEGSCHYSRDICKKTFSETWNTESYISIGIPTLQMACKWLREVHNIFIEIYLPSHSEHEDTIYHGTYCFDIFNLKTKTYVYCMPSNIEFNTYEEAVEAALKYILEKLI